MEQRLRELDAALQTARKRLDQIVRARRQAEPAERRRGILAQLDRKSVV
jgi:exonuclease VII small subunit